MIGERSLPVARAWLEIVASYYTMAGSTAIRKEGSEPIVALAQRKISLLQLITYGCLHLQQQDQAFRFRRLKTGT